MIITNRLIEIKTVSDKRPNIFVILSKNGVFSDLISSFICFLIANRDEDIFELDMLPSYFIFFSAFISNLALSFC
jgi:hypothetical protein